jgi:protease-4
MQMMKVLKTCWRGLDFLRRLTLNLFFLLVLGAIIFAFFYEKPVSVPNNAVLLVTLSGQIVEEDDFDGQGTFSSMVDGSDSFTRLRDVTRALSLAAEDKRIAAVHFRVQDLQKAGLASLREIGAAMDRVKAAGKKITVWSTGYSQIQYAVAAHANEVFVHPMGGVMLKGLSGTRLYWGSALKELGVTVHVYRAGDYKSAPEIFVRSEPSKESLAADRFWMKDIWWQYTANIESSRGLMPGAVDKVIATYPELLEKAQGDMSRVALDQSLIDSVHTADEVIDILRTRMGWKSATEEKLLDYRLYLEAAETVPSGKRIAVVTIEGEIKDGGDGPGMTGERDAVRCIRAVRESPDYAALVVRIDSPGGSPVASELIRRELELVKKAGKPVVASFGDYAASGGYWVALGADTIVTDPMSITGSIGVFGMMPTFEKAISRLSLGTGGVATSPLADAMNPLKSVTPEYGKMMELSVARIYRDFISLVAKGRKMDEQKVAALAQGRVFTGRQAIDMGLADTLGGLDVALARAAEMANVPGAQAEFIERDGSGLSVMVMRLMRRAMVETGFAEAMRLATPAVQVLEPVQRLQQMVSGSMPLYAHCLCTPQ